MKVLYVSRTSGVHDARFVDAWLNAGFEVEAVATGLEDVDNGVRSALDSFQPDLVQVGPLTNPASEVLAHWDGPLIATSWGFDLMNDIDLEAGARLSAQAVISRADAIFVDNDGPARKALELGAGPDQIIQFPWGINRSIFYPGEPAERSDDFLVLSTRRHEPIYRVGDTVEAFLIAAETNSTLRLVVAGGGSLTGELRRTVELAGMSDCVEFVGEQSAEGLARLYREAQLYISASAVDGTSVSLLEAMACGVPVIVSDIVGNRQWVTERTGHRFDVGDVASLVALIASAAGGDETIHYDWSKRAAAGLHMIKEHADWAKTEARFAEIAATVVAKHAKRTAL